MSIAGILRISWISVIVVGVLTTGCANEMCHMGTHVGAFTGDEAGEVTLDLSRVDEDTLVDVTLTGEDDVVLGHADLVAVPALESGCSDLTFEGDLLDDDGEAIGTFEGALTTTTGEGTWALDSGEEGTWSLGTL